MKNLKSLFSVLCLLITSIVTIATSKKPADQMAADQAYYDSLVQKDYFVASNCPQALYQERITIANGRVLYPTNRNFVDFGIPTLELNLTYSSQVSGLVNGHARSCVRSELVDQGIPLILYSCTENAQALCQVSFERIQ